MQIRKLDTGVANTWARCVRSRSPVLWDWMATRLYIMIDAHCNHLERTGQRMMSKDMLFTTTILYGFAIRYRDRCKMQRLKPQFNRRT